MDRINKILDFVNASASSSSSVERPKLQQNQPIKASAEPMAESAAQKQTSQSINDIDEHHKTTSQSDDNEDDNKHTDNEVDNSVERLIMPSAEPMAESAAQKQTSQSINDIDNIKDADNVVDNNEFNDVIRDNKKYNSLRRKLKKQQIYPCNINGVAFYNQEDINEYLKRLATDKRAYNKHIKQQKIKETKLNIDELDELHNETDDIVEDDGYLYKHNNPIGVIKGNKAYKLPTTNKADRNDCFNEIKGNKEVITKLLTTNDNNEFNDLTLSNIKNTKTKTKIKQHINNNIVKDNTWNKNEFIKLMEKLMSENDEKINRTNVPQPITNNHYNKFAVNNIDNNHYIDTPRPTTPYGLNPQLFRKI